MPNAPAAGPGDEITPPGWTEIAYADQADRGSGSLQKLQGVQLLWWDGTAWQRLGTSHALPAGLYLPDGTAVSSDAPLPTRLITAAGGAQATITGIASTVHEAGDQVGAIASIALEPGHAVELLGVSIWDPAKKLAVDSDGHGIEAWIVQDFGGGITDAGDDNPFDLDTLSATTAPLVVTNWTSTDIASGRRFQAVGLPARLGIAGDASVLLRTTADTPAFAGTDLVFGIAAAAA